MQKTIYLLLIFGFFILILISLINFLLFLIIYQNLICLIFICSSAVSGPIDQRWSLFFIGWLNMMEIKKYVGGNQFNIGRLGFFWPKWRLEASKWLFWHESCRDGHLRGGSQLQLRRPIAGLRVLRLGIDRLSILLADLCRRYWLAIAKFYALH